MGLNLLFDMGETTWEEIQEREPLTHALFSWLKAIDAYTYAVYEGDEEHDYRSKKGDNAR